MLLIFFAVGPSSPLKSPRVTSPIKSPRVASPVKSPRVSSPVKSPRVATPLKSPRVAYPIRGTSDKVASLVGDSQGSVENKCSEQQQVTDPNVEIKNDNNQVNGKRDKDISDSSGGAAEQTAQAPKRARLRRFGTVNVGLTRGPKTPSNESLVVDHSTTSETEGQKIDREMEMDIKESVETNVDNVSSELNKEGETNTNEGSGIHMQQKRGSNIDMAEAKAAENVVDKAKPKPTTRARLPKAKPNFLDAARKRSK